MSYQYRPVWYFGVIFAASWGCLAISAALATSKDTEALASLFYLLGLLVLPIVVLLMIYRSGNAALKADFRDRLINVRRISPRHLLATFLVPPAIVALALWLSLGFGQTRDQFALSGPVDQLLPLIILGFVLAPLAEELAWRGYGMDSLRARTGTLGAALLFGVLWSVWHAPAVFIKGSYHYELAHMDNPLYLVNFFVSVVIVSVFITWLYYRHNRSIIAGILLHSMLNAAAILPAATQPTKCIVTGLYLVVAIVIVLLDRQLFSEGPRNFVAEK